MTSSRMSQTSAALALDHLLRGLDRRGETTRCSLREDERLEQLERHLLRQTALVQLQRRADHDHRTTGVVDALAEQVLTEPALLALDHVGERLQRTLVRAGDRATATAVVEQRIDRFLQHALLVAHDDVGRVELEQTLQAVVAVDHAAIQIVQIRRREAAAIERHQRTQVRRQHRQHGHDHPLGAVARVDERFDQLQALRQPLDLRLGVRRRNFFAQTNRSSLRSMRLQQRLNRFGTHARVEFIAVLFDASRVLLVGQQLAAHRARSYPNRRRHTLRNTACARCRAASCRATARCATAATSGTRCARPGSRVRCGPCDRGALSSA